MTAQDFSTFLWFWIGLALLLIPLQIFVKAPYGRHRSTHWGPVMDNKFGWIIMELVAPVIFLVFLIRGKPGPDTVTLIATALFILHYIHRSLIFPFQLRTKGKTIPVLIVLFAIIFNSINGFTNGYYLGSLSPGYPEGYLADWRFLSGISLFVVGAIINIRSDRTLIRLRNGNSKGDYSIPRDGLFQWVSCPNHLGEIIEWIGFAILCWHLAAVGFAVWTIANLIPRALHHHRWYRSHFSNYPAKRKAILPFII
jgi:protein-S-isoprenylcysteine O-methyltransferase Ste14